MSRTARRSGRPNASPSWAVSPRAPSASITRRGNGYNVLRRSNDDDVVVVVVVVVATIRSCLPDDGVCKLCACALAVAVMCWDAL